MNFVSIRLVTDDVPRLVAFYEEVTGTAARWATEVFAEIVTPSGVVAVAGRATMAPLDGAVPVEPVPGAGPTVIVEFLVADVDAEHERLGATVEAVSGPTTMPWGNRSLLLRDPEGNLVNLFTPVSEAAVAKYRGVPV